MVALLPSRSASIPRATPLTRTATSLLLTLALISAVSAQTATGSLPARWGQASALVGSLFLVQGGKTQGTTGGGYTYDSAPSDAQMYALDLSSGFPLSSPPWQAVSVEADQITPPAVSFHTISPLNSTSLLLFGGDGSPMLPIQTRNDSAYLLHLGGSASNRTVNYQTVPTTWGQPMRRLYHTSETNGRGQILILGGQKADGSQILLDEQWSIDTSATSPTFQLASPSPPGSLVGSTSTMLSDATLLLLGGLDPSGQLQSMQNLYTYSTRSRTWSQTTTTTASSSNQTLPARQTSGTSAAFPAPRRDHIAVSLPNQRVFIQGGANADLSAVYSDAWILDWSVNPPVWTQLESTGGPGARYAHSAVAYGRQVLISFGWSGANAAPTALYVFDASTLLASTSTQGSWSGGSWSSTTYTPDPEVTRPSTPASSSGSSSGSSSNGSSSSSGGSSTPSSDSNNSSDSNGSDTSSGSFPTNPGTSGNHGSAHADGASDGAKAGAAIGALLGAGLIVGVGYAAYRRRSLNNYRRYGDASVGLLGLGGGRGAGPDDDDYLMEKGEYHRPYHCTEGGGAPLTGGVGYGRKRGRSEGAAWTAANVGHAMEGSGPHFRQRIAILAGRGKRDTHVAPRVDMLADEGDGNSLFRPQHPQERSHLYNDQDEEDLDSPPWNLHQLREHSYAQVGEEDLSLGDLGRLPHHDDREAMGEHDMCSPFEDRPEESRTEGIALMSGSAHEYGKLADRKVDGYEGHSDDDGRSDFDFGPSIQSHDTASKSDVPSSSKSYDVLATGGMVSFSDASHGHRSAQGSMKRSPTWWDRFMGNSLLERTASGKFLTGPNANVPIRDPAPPPVSGLEAITESPRSRDVSEANPNQAQDPFADSDQLHMDQMGRRLPTQGEEPYPSHSQGRSLSSIGSARTNASSHFELRLRGMDVIQRVPTSSSRRTQSTTRTGSTTSDTDSEQALSRRPTLLRPKNVASSEALGEEDKPESLVWRPEDITHPQAGLEDLQEEQTEDLAQTSYPGVQSSSPPLSWSRAGQRKSNVSETPSITPLTTKRARLNPAMVSPLFPSAQPRLTAPVPTVAAPNASVRDKVKAFESQSSTTPENASIWTASLSSAKSRTFGTTDTETGDTSAEAMERATSPSSTATGSRRGGKKAKYYIHGLVPKAQLFVANPDGSDS